MIKCSFDNFHVNFFCTYKFLLLQNFLEGFNLCNKFSFLFFSKRKAILCCLLSLLTYLQIFGQDCSCPPINTCGCDVGLTKLTVEFTGLLGLTVIVEDEGGVIHSGLLLVNGSIVDIESSAGVDQPFVGDLVTIRTTLAVLATINTSCVDPVTIGSTFGDYTVIGGESVGGTPICCEVMESTDPVISGCPSDIVIDVNPTSCGENVSWTAPTVSDNCNVMSFTNSHNPGDFFTVGSPTLVAYTAEDDYGNTAACSFNVTVNDNTDPVINNCPTDINIVVDPSCQATATWTEPTATDNCSVTMSSDHTSGEVFSLGTTIVTYTAQDAAGNTTTCSFNVIVTDDTPPVINNCPTDINIVVDPSCQATATWTEPTATDNCGIADITSTHQPGDIFPEGTTEVTYTATDVNRNSTKCTFNVIINNDDVPVVSACPDDITDNADDAGEAVITWNPPTVENACGGVVLVSSHDPGSVFTAGTTNVTYWDDNDPDQTILCSFNVVVTNVTENKGIDIADVITPDGDEINDKWIIGNIENFSDNKVVVADRWGNVIYEAAGYNNGTIVWTGMINNGILAPTGTYFYYVEVTLNGKRVRETGFIELIQ